MHIREYTPDDLTYLVDLTIETFGPFYEDVFRPLVGETVFATEHGAWREDYRTTVPTLHDPPAHKYLAVAEDKAGIAGYVAWDVDLGRGHGNIEILAVPATCRRGGTGTALCEHAFTDMRQQGMKVAGIGTGGDAFHAPARALYASLGCTELLVSVFYKQL